MMLYICTKFRENNQRVSELLSGCDLNTKICKRSYFFIKYWCHQFGGVMVLGLSTSSDNALYWYRSTSLTCTRRVSRRRRTSVQIVVRKCALRH